MNRSKRMFKLKLFNSILAIVVAFLLLTLMIPNVVFATESIDVNLDYNTKEVNTETVANHDSQIPTIDGVSDNSTTTNTTIIITGNVSYNGTGISDVSMSAFKGGERVCDHGILSESDGSFSIELYDSVKLNDPIMIMANDNTHAFEVIATTADTQQKNIVLQEKVAVSVKPVTADEDNHDYFDIYTIIGDQQSYQKYTQKSFAYSFPVGGKFQMTANNIMLFHYINNLGQEVNIKFSAHGKGLYRPYYWGYQVDFDSGHLMKIGQDYILQSGHNYVAGLAYLNQTKMLITSKSAGHDHFNFSFVKNDIEMHEMSQAEFDTTTYDGAKCTVQENGNILINFEDSDDLNEFVIVSTVQPVPKAGYKFANWTYNGKELKAGDSVEAKADTAMNFVADYKVDASSAPATGDFAYIWVSALCSLALISMLILRVNSKR